MLGRRVTRRTLLRAPGNRHLARADSDAARHAALRRTRVVVAMAAAAPHARVPRDGAAQVGTTGDQQERPRRLPRRKPTRDVAAPRLTQIGSAKIRRAFGGTMFRKVLAGLVVVASSLGAVGVFTTSPASASGYRVTGAPGKNCFNQTKWVTSSRTSTTETLYVNTVGQCPPAIKFCNYGMSVWYNDSHGVRRNVYKVNSGCTLNILWLEKTGYFTAKRGTSVQVTFRWNGTWINGFTFGIS